MASEEELFDVVDEKDPTKVLRHERRSVVHREGLHHRSVNAMLLQLVDDCPMILIQKRTPQKDVCPNMWDVSVAEHLQLGEGYFRGGIFLFHC